MKRIALLFLLAPFALAEPINIYDNNALITALESPGTAIQLILHVQNNGENIYEVPGFSINNCSLSITADIESAIEVHTTTEAKFLTLINCYNSSISNIKFVGTNSGNSIGNGIAVRSSNITISNCEFELISSRLEDGPYSAIFSDDSIINIYNCIFNSNKCRSDVFSDYDAGGGGAIAAIESDVKVYNSNFDHNEALLCAGGAIFSFDSNLDIDNQCNFFGNSSDSRGGAIYFSCGTQDLLFKCQHSTFSLSTAGEEGGAIYVDAFFTSGSTDLTFHELFLDHCSAESGGGIELSGSPHVTEFSYNNFINCNATNGVGLGSGGGFYFYSYSNENMLISNTNFIECSSFSSGGGATIFCASSGLVIFDKCLFQRNFTTSQSGGGGACEYSCEYGPGILDDSIPLISNSQFIGNTSARTGGAISFWCDGDFKIVK